MKMRMSQGMAGDSSRLLKTAAPDEKEATASTRSWSRAQVVKATPSVQLSRSRGSRG